MSKQNHKTKPVIQEKRCIGRQMSVYACRDSCGIWAGVLNAGGKNDGVIFMQWHIYMMLMLGISMPMSRMLFKKL